MSFVGIYDMLRHQLFANGRYNETEYGNVANAAQFRALYAYSPYSNVHAGTRYPAVLLETGVNDPRVAPWQSRKFAAALQAATVTRRPVLLVTRRAEGHGGVGATFSERVGNAAMALIFFAHELRQFREVCLPGTRAQRLRHRGLGRSGRPGLIARRRIERLFGVLHLLAAEERIYWIYKVIP